MILTTRKALEEETYWVRTERHLKTCIYSLMHELVQAQVFSSLIYKVLIVIETLQFLWYAIHPHFSFLWTVSVVNWFREFLRVFQLDGYLTDGSNGQSVFIIALYIVLAIQVLITVLIILQIVCSSRKQLSTLNAHSIKLVSGYILLLNTILPIPFYYIFLSAFICRTGDPIHGNLICYKNIYFLHFAAALIGIILLIPTTLLTAIFCIDLNPWSSVPFAAPQSRLGLLKLLWKVLIPIFFIIDYQGNSGKAFLIVYTVFWFLMLILRYRQTPFYGRALFNLTLAMETILFWVSLTGILHAYIDDFPIDNIGFLFVWIGAPFIAFTYVEIVNKRSKIYRRLLMKNMTKDTEVEMYILSIISLIDGRSNIRKRMTLEGLLKYHMKNCASRDLGCACVGLHAECSAVKEQDVSDKQWYTWVKSIVLDGIQKFPKSSRLHILYAYIQREKLLNKFKALFEIMYANSSKPTVEEEFSIFRYKNLIEEEMVESDMKTAESKGVNVNVIVEFENKFVDFQGVIGASVELHLDFWRELLEDNPEILKLQSLGSLITKSVEDVHASYRALSLINSNHVKMLNVYGNFLKDVVNDDTESFKILDKAAYNDRTTVVNRQFLDNDRIKYGDNSDTCIITVSGEANSIGIVINSNNEITRILGFTKSEIIGQNIYNIMPKFLSEIHDGFMMNYFESADAKVIAIERTVFPTTKQGYIVPCTLMAKVLPNLNDGLKLVGFLKEIDRNLIVNKEQEGETEEEEEGHYVMYDENTGAIHGITHGCNTEFGIPASLIRKANAAVDEFTIDQIFPELPTIEELKSSRGLITIINTTQLEQDYFIEKEESEESEYGTGEEKERKFRKARVKISLFQDDEYGEISLRVLRFVEIKEEEDGSPRPHRVAVGNNEPVRKEESNAQSKVGERKSLDNGENEYNNENNEGESESQVNDINDEIKDLKEFKALISEKTVPKSIILLRTSAIIIYTIILALESLNLGLHYNAVDEFSTGTAAISNGYKRHDLIANINYRLRKLQLLATDIITTTDSTAKNTLSNTIKSQGNALLDQLRSVSLSISDIQNQLQDNGYPTYELDSVQIESLIQTGTKISQTAFSDAMSQYISHATSVNNAALTSLTSTSVADSTRASFAFVKRNGLGPLRAKSESNAQKLAQYYLDRADAYDSKFEMVLIGLLVLIFLSELVLIPIIFSVHRTATKVLSLFGHIPLCEINILSTKCEQYVKRYLDNYKTHQDYKFEDEEVPDRDTKTARIDDRTYIEVNKDGNESVHIDANASYLVEMSLDDSVRKVSGLKVPETVLLKSVNGPNNSIGVNSENKSAMENSRRQGLNENYNTTINNLLANAEGQNQEVRNSQQGQKKEDEKKALVQENEEDVDVGHDRPHKLMNSKDNIKSKVAMQFVVVGALFMTAFGMEYLVKKISLDNTKTAFAQLQVISQKMSNIRFMNDFTVEIIAEGSLIAVYNYSGQLYVDYRLDYQSRTLADGNQLQDGSSTDLPSQFDPYLSALDLYKTQDLCSVYYGSSPILSAACYGIAGQFLTNGLTISITRITQLSNDLMTLFNNNTKDSAGKQIVVNSLAFTQADQIIDMISPVVDTSKEQFLASFNDYLTYSWTIARVRFGVFVGLALIVFVVIWTPYLKSLKEKIFKTKGMLNMIPMDLIAKNANLRSPFVNSADILQAVK